MSAFADAVAVFTVQNIPVVPTRPDQPSKPMVYKPNHLGVSGSRELASKPRFATANAAIWMGRRSRLTLVDVDSKDPAIHAQAEKDFGPTPLITETPSGGRHLWYRTSGEGRHIRPFGDGYPVDVLGEGGLAVVPPSRREASAEKCAGEYRVLDGSLSELERLPPLRAGILPAAQPQPTTGARVAGMREGDGRDDVLFQTALRLAHSADSEDALARMILAENAKMAEPLEANIALAKARSAWRYKARGTLRPPEQNYAMFSADLFQKFKEYPPAFNVFGELLISHGRQDQFHIVPEAIADQVRLSANTVRRAVQFCLEAGCLERLPNRKRTINGNMAYVYGFARAKI